MKGVESASSLSARICHSSKGHDKLCFELSESLFESYMIGDMDIANTIRGYVDIKCIDKTFEWENTECIASQDGNERTIQILHHEKLCNTDYFSWDTNKCKRHNKKREKNPNIGERSVFKKHGFY